MVDEPALGLDRIVRSLENFPALALA